MKKRLGIIMVCLCISGTLSACGILPKEEEYNAAPVLKEYEGMEYGKVEVTRGDMVDTDEISATWKGTEKQSVVRGDGDSIKKVYVTKGSKVKAGDLLIRYELSSAETQLSEARYKIATLTLTIKHEQELMQAEISKQKKVDNDQAQIKMIREQHQAIIDNCQIEIKIAKLQVKENQDSISDEDSLAKINGVVTFVKKGIVGESPAEDTELITIEGAKRNRFEAVTEYANRFSEGQVVQISVRDKTYQGTVVKSKDGKKIYVYIKGGATFNSGDGASIQCILKSKKNVLYLPSAAIFKMGNKNIVYYENDKGLKTMKEVTIGDTISAKTEILTGLSEGDQVITN